MTKFLKSFLSIALCIVLLVPLASTAFAVSGEGTSANPYVITTAEELQNINNNLSAYYILGNDIDLSTISQFTPIGNSDDGTFTGSFNGSGYKISNLNVYAGKYAGLFGVNEGTIENVVLENATVYGTRFVAGLCAYNAETGVIKSSSVTSGEVSSDGSVIDAYTAGVVAMNKGEMQGAFSNGANVTLDNNLETPSYVAGVVACISNSKNEVVIDTWKNTGNIECFCGYSVSAFVGGIIAHFQNSLTIINSCNNGNISLPNTSSSKSKYCGGLLGCGDNVVIEFSYNVGRVKGYKDYYSGSNYFGGLIGVANHVSINACFNSGMITEGAYNYSCSPFVGDCDSGSVIDSYNTGNCGCIDYLNKSNTYYYNNTDLGDVYVNTNIRRNVYLSNGGYRTFTTDKMCDRNSYTTFDFENIWCMDKNVNSGLPTLKVVEPELILNKSFCYPVIGTTIELIAYKNGEKYNNVEWSYDGVSVSITGNKATFLSTGYGCITATDEYGNKANCNFYVPSTIKTITSFDREINISAGKISNYEYINTGYDSDYYDEASFNIFASCESSDESVVKVSDDGLYITPVSVGEAYITYTDVRGLSCQQKITVVDTAVSLELPSTLTVARDSDKAISATTKPAVTSTPITWTSSDESVATVSENGVVHGVSLGTAIITAKTENGLEDTCTVTVNAPTNSIAVINNKITLQKGMTDYVKVVTDPVDTTSSISYSSSNSNVTVNSSTGLITAKYVGTSTITVTSNGKKTYCTVNVIDVPVILTDLTLDKSDETMNIGESLAITATLTPTNATQKNITWASTDETVASVNYNGVVTAKGAGKTIITATAENGLVAYCQITVNGVPSADISKIYIPDLIGTSAEYIDVPVMIENNPGINFAHLRILYDENSLEPLSVTNGTVFDSVLGSLDEKGVAKLCFTSETDKTTNGVLATIRFKVLNTTGSKEIKLCYFPSEIKNAETEIVSMNLYDSVLTYDIPCVHSNTKIINVISATCDNNGYTGDKYCGDCKTVIETGSVIKAKGHTTRAINSKPATCTVDGYTGDTYCSTCKTTTAKGSVIKAKGHTTSVINAKSATCTADGYTGDTYCSVCKTTTVKGKAITKLGHSYNAGEITTKATCEKDGVKTFTCTRCKTTKTEIIKAIGHKEVVIPAVAPTFTTVGKTEGKKCSVCGTVTVAQKDVAKLTLSVPVVKVVNASNGVKVTWNAIENAESYKVYRKTYNAKTKKWGSWKSCGTVTTTSYVDKNAKTGTKYKYTVKALNGDVKSDIKSSSTILFLTQPTVKIANASTGVKVTWNKITGATGYKVYRSQYSNGKWSGWKSVKTIDKASTITWTDKSAKSGVKYKYTVKAVNGKTSSTYKSSSSLLYLAQPTVTVKAVSNGVKVNWTQSTGATSYTIYRSEYNAKTKKWSGWKSIKAAKSTSKSYTDKSAKKGVKYRYTVKAVNGKVASTYKASGSVKR